ncbi:MAG TPA: SEC-C domain-containing protein [Symbiobacteriaceae bacterium]
MTRGNDRCPCGSRKRYKNCCGSREQVISLTRFRYDRAYNHLMEDLADFCMEYEGEDVERAQTQFFGIILSNVLVDEQLAESLHYAFLDWFAFSYHNREEGTTMVAAFKKGRTDSTELELLTAWERSHPGFYLVERYAGDLVVLRDAFTGQLCHTDLGPGHLPAKDSLVLGRLLPTGEIWRPGFDLVEGNATLLEAVTPLLKRELFRMQRAVPEAGWDDLFRERWPLVRDLTSLALLAQNHGLVLRPPAPEDTAASLGIVAPPPGVPERWLRVYDEILLYASEAGLAYGDTVTVLRLWWDVAMTLQPKVIYPGAWAAAVLYVWHRWIHLDDEVTQAQLASRFEITASIISKHSREITRRLAIVELDDRYADILDPRVRGHVVMDYLAQAGIL